MYDIFETCEVAEIRWYFQDRHGELDAIKFCHGVKSICLQVDDIVNYIGC